MKKVLLTLSIFVIVFGTAALPIFADAIVTVEGNSPSITAKTVIFDTVTLNGLDQTTNGQSSEPWVAVDPTGTWAGWYATISSTPFTNITPGFEGKQIDWNQGTGLRIKLRNENVNVAVSENGEPHGDPDRAPYSLVTDYTKFGNEPIAFVAAEAEKGMGTWELTPVFDLYIPAETYRGSYQATFTVTIHSGTLNGPEG